MHFYHSLLLFVGLSSASLIHREPPTRVVDKRAATCTPVAGGSGSIDDVPAIEAAIKACPSGTIVIPAATTYYVNSAFTFAGCTGCTVQIEGTLKVASDTSYWEGRSAILTMSGITGAKVYSATGSGLIDGNGQDAYDLFASNSSYARPTLFYTTASSNIIIQNLRFKNAPNVFHSVGGSSTGIQFIDVSLSAVSKSANPAANTDGWDIGASSYVTITGATVINDDDCVAFKPGSNYVTVTNITCTGSHGLSVGSVGNKYGTTDVVQNVYVSGATMINSAKAAGIKLYPAGPSHGSATVTNITWDGIVVDNSDYAFQIQSCYGETAAYCAQYPSTAKLSGIVVKNVSGTTSTHYEPVVMNLDCPAAGTCGVTMSGVSLAAPSGTAKYLCANTPSTLGVTCTSGATG